MEENKSVDEKTIVVIDDDGSEKEMEILFTFNDDEYNKSYVLYVDPADETGEVFVSSYTEEGELNNVTEEKEWAMIEEVFNTFIIQAEEHVHDENCNHDHNH
ncbi:DUF1292 domain-containing protein [Erysipelothrix inopinata]|uniref:UPF0473 protein H9L01_09800 n=1 Tax=Erysipelothrix inopinata TaxID=225084 RepID=A0A7G9RYH0_9FIRM|nr:DUF1292 domain-containing protein [Erysipelothrix inopinata]QNN60645.1 DUF1292 domain-containing protein [Erysipelothrix inopinata]